MKDKEGARPGIALTVKCPSNCSQSMLVVVMHSLDPL